MEEKTIEKREEYSIRIGPLLKKALDKQKDNIKKVTYECVAASDYDAGEIIAKKLIQKNLL